MKNRFGKIVSIIIITLLVLIVVVAVLIKIFGNTALKAAVETGAGKAMKVGVHVKDISLSIFAGKLDIKDLVVDNPEGFQNPTFLELGGGLVELKTKSLLSDTVEIEKMQLDNIHLTIEQKGLTSNLKEILNNLPKAAPEEEKPAEEKAGKDLLIKQLDINGVKVTVKLLPVPGRADNLTLTLAPIHMENIGTKEKVNTPKLVAKILLAIAGGIAEKGKDLLPMDMINSITDQLSQQGQKLLEAGKNIGTGVIEGGIDVGKGATDALKNLNPFQKKEEEPEK